MMPYHCHRCGSNFVITMLLPSLLLFTIVCLRNVNTAKFYEKNGRNNGGNTNNINDRLHFITEPESVFASTDGRRINFKCMVSPSEAQIKWLLNGTIINDDSYEWIKMNENKLSIKLQKPLVDPTVDEDGDHQNGDQKEQKRSHPYHSHHNSHHHHHHHHQNQQQNINLQGAVFQCLAEWNDQVIVSQPAKLIIAELSPFDDNQQDINITAISGNNVVIPCELPHSIPVAVAEFEFNNITISNSNITQDRYRILPSGHLLITNVKPFDSGSYRCIAHNPFLQERMFAKHLVNLKVIKQKNASPDLKRLKFTLLPKQQIIAILGSNITLECVPHGHPVPKVSWTKINGELPKSRAFVDNGALIITSVQKEDEGIYSCNAFNTKTTLDSNTELKVYEMPQIVNDEYEILEMEKGQNYELFCNAKGTPKPLISWLHNGYFIDSQITNDVFFEQDGAILKIIGANPQLHGGIFQCFATNELGTTYAIKVIQFKSTSEHQHSIITNSNDEFVDNNNANQNNDHKQSDRFNADINFDLSEFSMENNYNPFNDDHPPKLNGHGHPKKHKHKNKDLKLIPPSKPEVIKINDESVMVRWHVPKSTGLPIMFFKVQYKELGRGDWNTVDVDIPPHIFSHPVCCLNPNSTYRFRIAAVYSNDDNKTGKSSNKFVFQKDPAVKRPIHPPTILNATSLTPYKIIVEWEYLNIEMQQVDGFFINYRAADSAGQYLMVTAMGANIRQQNISYLQPNTAYEIKMQCFNEAGTSDFSNIYMVKTMPLATNDVEDPKPPPNKDITKPLMDNENMQLIVILVVSITALLVFIVCATICCMRQKSNQSSSKIKKEKVIKPPSDYYFTSINNYDRRLSNGQLNTISGSNNLALTGTTATIPMLPSVPHANNNHVPDDPPNPNAINTRVNALNEMPTTLNRRNSFRNSLSYSSHHLYSSNNNIKHNETNHLNNHETSNGINGAANSGSTATIDRKRPLKNSIPGPYLDQYSSNSKINHHHHHSASFTRLNGTLERKRRSRNDLNGISDRNSIYNHRNGGINQNNHSINNHDISANDLDRQCSNGNSSSSYFHHHLPQNGGHFVIMQSSC